MELPFLSDNEKAKAAEAKAAEAKDRLQTRFLTPRVIVPLFAAVIALLLIGSFVTVRHENKQQEVATETIESEDDQSSFAAVSTKPDSINANILIAFADASDRKLHMVGVLHVDSDEGKLSAKYIDPEERIKVNNFDGTMQEHYRNGGISELLWAVRENLAITINRYIMTDDDNFTNAVKLLGEMEITLDKSVNANYKGINFIIEKGTQNLTADMMQKYFTYLCSKAYTDEKQDFSDMLAFLFSRFLKPESEKSLDELYGEIVNYISTDISVIDITDYSAAAVSMLGSENVLQIETE